MTTNAEMNGLVNKLQGINEHLSLSFTILNTQHRIAFFTILIPTFSLTLMLACAALIVALVAVVAAAILSHHKKSGTGEIKLLGMSGAVETALEPEGYVLVRGELWRARTRDGKTIPGGVRVRIVGANGCLLEVEQAPCEVAFINTRISIPQ